MSNLVTIIVPCYNQADYLPFTLQSVLEQTHTHWECLIIDDGSPDHTAEIAKQWINKDDRFRYIKKENGGLSSARNKGLESANGDWIQFLDSDDLLDKNKLKESVEQQGNMVISNFDLFQDTLDNILPNYCNLNKISFSFEAILQEWDKSFSIPIHCGLFQASLVGNTRFNEHLKAKEDWMFWIEIFSKKPTVSYLKQPLAWYRIHQKSMTKDTQLMIENLTQVQNLIYDKIDPFYKDVFFKRVTADLEVSQKKLQHLNSIDNVYDELLLYKKYKEKYYNIWYKKLFYNLKKSFTKDSK